MPRGANVDGPDWSAYGACETCGSVAGWPCSRGTRVLKNPHPGRPRTGGERYVVPTLKNGNPTEIAPDQDFVDVPLPGMPIPGGVLLSGGSAYLRPEMAATLGADYLERANAHAVPAAELTGSAAEVDPLAPWGWAEIALRGRDPEDVIAGNEPADAKLIDFLDAQGAGAYYDGPAGGLWNGDQTTTETTMANDATAEAADWTARLDNADREPKNPSGKKRVDSEVPKDIDRDQYDRPLILRAEQQPDGTWAVPRFPDGPEPHAGKPIPELEGYTRASTLGNALEDGTGLNTWRGGMIVFGMSRRKDLTLAAQAIPGTEDKKLHRRPLYDIARQALEAAESSSAATVGTALHALTEQADRGQLTVDIGEYQSVLDAYLERMTGWKVVRSETFVVSDYFHAAGSFDRLITPLEPMALVDQMTGEIIAVIMPGDLVVVDLKTSTTADYFGAKFFAQLAVYVTGQEYDRDRESPTYGARTPLGQRTDFALILHIPQGGDADGEPAADWHWLDMRAGLALAQLACVVLETRKKRFSRTHMRPVHAQPVSLNLAAEEDRAGITAGPFAGAPARDPLGAEHLAATAGFIAETESFPDAEADIVDAELIEDGREPETRTLSPAALDATNAERLVGPSLGDPDDDARDAELAQRLAAEEARAHSDPQHWVDGGHMPGPEETAPLPDGWESKAEQELAQEATMGVPSDRAFLDAAGAALGPSLQEAAKRHAVETKLIRKIQAATVIQGERDSIMDLYQRASAAGAWSDRVKAAASNRRAELERRAAG